MRADRRIFLVIISASLIFSEAAARNNSTELYKNGLNEIKGKNLIKAEENFLEAVKMNPSYCLAHYGLGRVYLQTGRLSDAEKHLIKTTELDPSFTKGYFYLGIAQLLSGRNIKALHSFESAYSRDSTMIESLYNMGVIYDLLGNEYRSFHYFRLYFRMKSKDKDDIF